MAGRTYRQPSNVPRRALCWRCACYREHKRAVKPTFECSPWDTSLSSPATSAPNQMVFYFSCLTTQVSFTGTTCELFLCQPRQYGHSTVPSHKTHCTVTYFYDFRCIRRRPLSVVSSVAVRALFRPTDVAAVAEVSLRFDRSRSC